MARYLLVGALGGPNFGDELILLTWINIIRQRDSSAEIYCDGYNLFNLKELVGDLADVVSQDESLWNVCKILDVNNSGNYWNYINKKTKENTNFNIIIDCLAGLRERKIDQIHFVGGGYLNALWQSNYMLVAMSCLLSRLTGARLIATGLGLTPTNVHDLPGLQQLLKSFDLVDVRDESSYNLLNDMDIDSLTYTGDDVLLVLSDDYNIRPLQYIAKKSLVLCLQNDLFDGDGIAKRIFTPRVIKLLHEYAVTNIVFVMAMNADVSERTANLKSELINENFHVSTIDPFELLKNGFPISEDGLIITSRYHPHFLSALTGMAGVAITSMPYYDIKHEAVRTMGSNWKIIKSDFDCELLEGILHEELSNENLSYRENDRDYFINLKNKLIDGVMNLPALRTEFPIDIVGILKSCIVEIKLKEASIGVVEKNLIDKDFSLNTIESELFECVKKINLLEGEFQDYKNYIESSYSWKLTKPFRRIYSFFLS
ncbi:polysaccharide pyruvyl transferase family protein [Bacillus subtilis]|uniref:polysaccharide pyruvyl transferase family protein n=1 Tax=Pseudochrobactrum asaccharolyticum TaxID=354351 RepID=UPI001F40C482|nr:polysaccharide pyruvyl transferase family protein [Pseudochrobactrum asaccharolyticum]MCF7645051.1 polysaccharide pyruvyl transferase family protein [Pseudochrobactrum asaccharolyticum]MCF7671520.1 polysaccharide pyruvyl transferase family protein [Bacillus subtilis]